MPCWPDSPPQDLPGASACAPLSTVPSPPAWPSPSGCSWPRSSIATCARSAWQTLSLGTTLVLAACNRAIQPRSKRGWAGWAATTSLSHLIPGLKPAHFTSQFFWDQMDLVPVETLEAIERDVTKAVVADLGIVLDTLFYDTTNFFTYIDSTNTHCDLPQRGHSKQKRVDLRLMGFALLGIARWTDTAVLAAVPRQSRRRHRVPHGADPDPEAPGGPVARSQGRHAGLRSRQPLAEEPGDDRSRRHRLCQRGGTCPAS